MSYLRVSAKTGETTMDGLTVISINCEGCCGGSACAFHVEAWRKASRSQAGGDAK